MARRPQMTLDALKAAKPGAAQRAPESPEAEPQERKGQTLRLKVEAWRQLKMLAIEEGTTSHDLILQAVNLLFTAKGKPPVA